MERRIIGIRNLLVFSLAGVFGAGAASAQIIDPWIIYEDDQSASACAAVNTFDAVLVVLADTDELAIISGSDVILGDTQVIDGFVYFQGEPAGRITFETDGDGLRSVWWTDLTGHVVKVDGFTLVPESTDTFPEEYTDAVCDSTPLWDGCLSDDECADDNDCTLDLCEAGECTSGLLDGTACSDGDPCTIDDECIVGVCEGILLFSCCLSDDDCDDDNECTIDNCNLGICVHTDREGGCDDGSDCTTADECVNGVCVGVLVVDCDDDVIVVPPISIICGTSSALTLALTVVGLWGTGFAWRRRPVARP